MPARLNAVASSFDATGKRPDVDGRSMMDTKWTTVIKLQCEQATR